MRAEGLYTSTLSVQDPVPDPELDPAPKQESHSFSSEPFSLIMQIHEEKLKIIGVPEVRPPTRATSPPPPHPVYVPIQYIHYLHYMYI